MLNTAILTHHGKLKDERREAVKAEQEASQATLQVKEKRAVMMAKRRAMYERVTGNKAPPTMGLR